MLGCDVFPPMWGNVSDDVYIPLPRWVRDVGDHIFFTDSTGVPNFECLSRKVNKTPVIMGRT